MGLPKIDIVFKSLAKSAIKRNSRSTVALILKDKNVKGKLVTLENIKDITKELEQDNKEQIEFAFKGGYKTPKKVIFYCLKDEEKLEDALKVLEVEKWNIIAIPCLKKGEADKVATWIKGLREEGIKVQAILPDCKADSEAVINFTTTYVKVGEKTYTNTQYCSRIAGILAGTPLNISATYYVLNEVTDVPHIKKSDADKSIDNGELIIINDGEKCKIGRAVNSLTSTSEGISEDYKKIKVVTIMDTISEDIKKTFENEYIGKYANSYDNQIQFCLSIAAYFEDFEKENVLAKNLNKVEVDVEAMKSYWKARGVDLTNAKKYKIEENTCGSNVLLKGKVKILDAIEDLDFNIEM